MLTHMDDSGRPKMIDVGEKKDTKRIAVAKGTIHMKQATIERIIEGTITKGDVLSVAQTAGIMAAKNTASTIPMCHNIFITGVWLQFDIDKEQSCIHIEASASTIGKTGIEMESLNAVSVAALTIYDMCKSIDRSMTISNIRLIHKSGGKSGVYVNREAEGGCNMAKVVSINISDKKGIKKIPVPQAEFSVNHGIVGDAHGGVDHIKQVSLLADESVDKMRASGMELKPGDFAENITTSGLSLHKLPVGTKLIIGETMHEVSRIGKECHNACAIKKEVGYCIMPTEGIFTKVLSGGIVKVGDCITVIE